MVFSVVEIAVFLMFIFLRAYVFNVAVFSSTFMGGFMVVGSVVMVGAFVWAETDLSI